MVESRPYSPKYSILIIVIIYMFLSIDLAYSENKSNIYFFEEPAQAKSNYWLNALILQDKQALDVFLYELNKAGVMVRPTWELMNDLRMFQSCQTSDLSNAKWLHDRIVNIPSSAKL